MKTLTTHINESIKKPIFRGTLNQSSYKAVDLGLSVKWCSCNVGASKPEDPGLLFQWGRTAGYKYDDKNNSFLTDEDYTTTSDTEYKSGEVLSLEDDAAHVNMKGSWRMPTRSELSELYELPHKYIELNGIHGYEFTGKNENSIFIPMGGFYDYVSAGFIHYDFIGSIWSSTKSKYKQKYAYAYYFNKRSLLIYDYYHLNGCYIRGVCE